MEYLTVIEVSQKQNYIFRTNRLKENIGASILIRKITEELPLKIVEEMAKDAQKSGCETLCGLTQKGREKRLVKAYGAEYEAVLNGGGRSVHSFSTEECAKDFIKKFSARVLKEYPGIELFAVCQGYDENNEFIADAIKRLYDKLEEKKSFRDNSFRFYDTGLAQKCVSTEMPAVGKDPFGRYICAESMCKLKAAEREQNEIFKELLPASENKKYRFALEFSELGGTKGVKNYLAVTAIDGNKMGKKVKKFRDDFCADHKVAGREINREYKEKFFDMSLSIDRHYKDAIRKMAEKLADCLKGLIQRGVVSETVDKDGTVVLPLRPLILAGDDICYVSDARIAIALAKEVLSNIEDPGCGALSGIKMRACAGISMVKVNYPFFRAYELAEELCRNSKAVLRDDEDESVLDFHIVYGEIEGSISEIREKKYNNETLTNKPYFLRQKAGKDNTMEEFEARLSIFRNRDIFGRGIVKSYRAALSAGEAAARQYRSDKRLEDKVRKKTGKDMPPSYNEEGKCLDFDVIEMLDMYYELKGDEDK